MHAHSLETLKDAQAFLFDVSGTVLDWRRTVVQELSELRPQPTQPVNWYEFAEQWRTGYLDNVQRIAGGGEGPTSTDDLQRMLLDRMLASPKWSHVAQLWTEKDKQHLNWVWHRLQPWPDSIPGIQALKKYAFVVPVSNGNVRLQLDLQRYAKLPWDMVFSSELFGSYKLSPKVYLEASRHLSIHPSRCVVVASHLYDVVAASELGMKSVYIFRENEDKDIDKEEIKNKAEGGEVDILVSSLEELAELVIKAKAQ